jgi:hypothetical protein
MAVKHTHEQCQTVLKAIKDLTQQMGRVGDENVSNLADSVIQLCDQLLREPQK